MEFTAAERRVLERITPEGIPKIVTLILEKARQALEGVAIADLGGSTAKGTFLAGDHDVDLFVRFPLEAQDISNALEGALSKAFPSLRRVPGSRDYFQLDHEGYHFEFVPVLDISSAKQARNVTDVSPLHVEYVRRHGLADDIRLAKQFLKAAKAYGAESYLGGFSGHVVDLLVIHYGGFRELLLAAQEWREPVVIDLEGHHENPLRALNASKLASPLVLVDPIQPERNAAAALTLEKFRGVRERAKEYLRAQERAQEGFFAFVPLTRQEFARGYPGARIIEVRLMPLESKRDVAGAKCQKVFQHLERMLREHEFALLGSEWEFTGEEAVLLFALRDEVLPQEREIPGPPLSMKDAVAAFKKEHERVIERKGRAVGIEHREFRDSAMLVKDLLESAYVKGRVAQARLLEN